MANGKWRMQIVKLVMNIRKECFAAYLAGAFQIFIGAMQRINVMLWKIKETQWKILKSIYGSNCSRWRRAGSVILVEHTDYFPVFFLTQLPRLFELNYFSFTSIITRRPRHSLRATLLLRRQTLSILLLSARRIYAILLPRWGEVHSIYKCCYSQAGTKFFFI